MSIITIEEMRAMAETLTGPCVSIYMPAHRRIPGTEQDPIRFKNLLRDAEQKLDARGMRSTEVRELLAPAHKLLRDPAFWKFQSDGLAVFLAPNLTRHYRMPFNFIETLVVGERFHLKPLWQVLANDQRYFILAVSQKSVRLLEATGYGVVEVRLENVPENIGEILSRYDFEEQLQFHTRAQSSGATRSAVFHGQGLGQEDAFKRVAQFLREIDSGLSDVLRGEKASLVTAGDRALLALYRSVNSYRHLVEEGIHGNPDLLSDEDLRERSWRIVQPVLHRGHQVAKEKFLELMGTGKASDNLEAVIPAAFHGQIESIFVPAGVQRWGSFDPAGNSVTLHEDAELTDNDLLDFAALHTWLNNGEVFVVAPGEIPGTGALAAVYRY